MLLAVVEEDCYFSGEHMGYLKLDVRFVSLLDSLQIIFL